MNIASSTVGNVKILDFMMVDGGGGSEYTKTIFSKYYKPMCCIGKPLAHSFEIFLA